MDYMFLLFLTIVWKGDLNSMVEFALLEAFGLEAFGNDYTPDRYQG